MIRGRWVFAYVQGCSDVSKAEILHNKTLKLNNIIRHNWNSLGNYFKHLPNLNSGIRKSSVFNHTSGSSKKNIFLNFGLIFKVYLGKKNHSRKKLGGALITTYMGFDLHRNCD